MGRPDLIQGRLQIPPAGLAWGQELYGPRRARRSREQCHREALSQLRRRKNFFNCETGLKIWAALGESVRPVTRGAQSVAG